MVSPASASFPEYGREPSAGGCDADEGAGAADMGLSEDDLICSILDLLNALYRAL